MGGTSPPYNGIDYNLLFIFPIAWILLGLYYYLYRRCLGWLSKRKRKKQSNEIPVVRYGEGEMDEEAKVAALGQEKTRKCGRLCCCPSGSGSSSTSTSFPKVPNDACPVCLESYKIGDKLKQLPCYHAYHPKCIDPWIQDHTAECPMCRWSIFDGPPPVRVESKTTTPVAVQTEETPSPSEVLPSNREPLLRNSGKDTVEEPVLSGGRTVEDPLPEEAERSDPP